MFYSLVQIAVSPSQFVDWLLPVGLNWEVLHPFQRPRPSSPLQ